MHDSNLTLPFSDVELDPSEVPLGFVNSKGFGGNNATGFFVSPTKTKSLLEKRWGKKILTKHQKLAEKVDQVAQEYNQKADDSDSRPIYQFGEGVVEGEDLSISTKEILIPGFNQSIDLELESPYGDLQ